MGIAPNCNHRLDIEFRPKAAPVVRTKLLTPHCATRHPLDGDASLRRDRALSADPMADRCPGYTEGTSQVDGTTKGCGGPGDGFLLCFHAANLAQLMSRCKQTTR